MGAELPALGVPMGCSVYENFTSTTPHVKRPTTCSYMLGDAHRSGNMSLTSNKAAEVRNHRSQFQSAFCTLKCLVVRKIRNLVPAQSVARVTGSTVNAARAISTKPNRLLCRLCLPSLLRWLSRAWYLQIIDTPIELVCCVLSTKERRGDRSHKNSFSSARRPEQSSE